MYLVQHLQKKCNTLACLDYVITNHVSFEDSEKISNDLLVKRIELTTESVESNPMQLAEFFECMLYF